MACCAHHMGPGPGFTVLEFTSSQLEVDLAHWMIGGRRRRISWQRRLPSRPAKGLTRRRSCGWSFWQPKKLQMLLQLRSGSIQYEVCDFRHLGC